MVTIKNAEDLAKIIKWGETSTVQFKQTLTSQKQIADEMIAFANCRGGIIIFGIEDKTGAILGLDYKNIQEISRELGNAANEHVKPTIYLQTEVMEIDGKALLLAYIDEGITKPYKNINGSIYVKQGADKRKVNENAEILRLFHTSRLYQPDEEPILGTSVDDLDDKRLDRFLQKVYSKGRDDFDVPFDKLLRSLKITSEDGSLTLAGLLFFGKHPEWKRPAFIIKAVAFYGNDIGGTQYKDSRDLEGTIPEQFEQGMRFLENNLHHVQAGQNFNSLGVLEVSKIALEEILQNAQVHREYIKNAPIRLLIFDNRIEIISPGCLPGNMTVDSIQLGETYQRNPLLASFCAKTMVYRGLGSGIIRAKKDGARIEFRNDEVTNQLITTIWRNNKEKSASKEEKSASKEEKSASKEEKSASKEEKSASKEEKSASKEEKSASKEKKSASKEKKSASKEEKGLSKREQIINELLSFCTTPRTMIEITSHLSVKDRNYIKANYINPLLGTNLAMTYPDSPRSPKQKYYTISQKKANEVQDV